ncbi:hypothetical protein BC939DRAFT_457214 [Gamsiella multidivaricata]|uniref:uncharacterized protein n=1 Tax=Gamsiella multidivaricata TaxID=101098 RepID=UPI00221F1EC0|nr:uncharacterized protein BC939DRAFT_457214 [Gamsiella multidivaricata]KAI7820632.1 hypothetical protein BC939DRAFT_457214 [Gamsiella multidivaricata]
MTLSYIGPSATHPISLTGNTHRSRAWATFLLNMSPVPCGKTKRPRSVFLRLRPVA